MSRSSKKKTIALVLGASAAALLAACASTPASGPMSFFITSAGSGKGADLGGLAGADAQCQKLATAAGAGGKTWRAYLSVPPTFPSGGSAGVPAINARDRIGSGPWYNAKGDLIARDVDHLHNGNNISKATALDERGNPVRGRADKPNEHDILTGSRADGTAFAPQTDTTCGAWTKSGADGSAVVGHHDREGPMPEAWAKSWNFSHQSAGCSQEALIKTGGAGRFYCFAAR
ncbi:hypothetical protein QTH91_01980 [Variovorax dokdonensis]|uniref:Lectin n=1 Tax=Variovorax dokdonensis TaxID=344883 RepID=A0ABT7N5K7_9BURK|nr:hypothetical protein [Variovorax dokdonensis]MDM0043241.1 hypothetical protein [Variovorax dokdonensis]